MGPARCPKNQKRPGPIGQLQAAVWMLHERRKTSCPHSCHDTRLRQANVGESRARCPRNHTVGNQNVSTNKTEQLSIYLTTLVPLITHPHCCCRAVQGGNRGISSFCTCCGFYIFLFFGPSWRHLS